MSFVFSPQVLEDLTYRIIIGRQNAFDFGLDIDGSFLHGNLTLSPSEEDPDRLAGKLMLEGSG